jgi:hypothetical protein
MKKNLIALFLTLTVLMLSGSLSSVYSAAMTDYCQDPPLIPQPIDPNILFVLDTSGSMEWCAYYYNNGCDSDHDGDGILDHYNPTVGYEGYFTPDKFYTDVGGIYQENPNPRPQGHSRMFAYKVCLLHCRDLLWCVRCFVRQLS